MNTRRGFTLLSAKQSPKGFILPLVKQSPKGFTLIEVMVYAVALVLVVNILVLTLIQLMSLNDSSRRAREAMDNARRALDVVAQEIRHADNVYDPTSVFDATPGQLSLETLRDLPADETSTYVDFYIDDFGLYLKREGQTAQLITSEKVSVTNLVFSELDGYTDGPAVRIQLTVEYRSPISGPKNAVSVETTASLRSYQ